MKCGDISMEEYDLFQGQDGGSIPTSPLQLKIKVCRFKDIVHIFNQFHYKKSHMGGGISFCLGAYFNAQVMAGAVIGNPRHRNKYGEKCVEIRRMACMDLLPKNTESWMLGKIIWYIKNNTDIERIISYSDLSVGHKGIIYKAANFKEIGRTSPSKHVFYNGVRYHPRSLTINRPYSFKLREGLLNGDTKIVNGEPKIIYEYKILRKEKI